MNTPLRKREGQRPSDQEDFTQDEQGQFQAVFHSATRSASKYWRLARIKRFVSFGVMAVAALAMLWLALLLAAPSWVKGLPVAGLLAGAGLFLAMLAGWLSPIRRDALLHSIDQRLSLPDLALSAGELPAGDAWNDRLWKQAAEALSGVDWRRKWPTSWRKGSGLACLTLLVTLPLLTGIYHVEMGIPSLVAQPTKRDTERLATFEALFKDWEQAAKEEPNEEWQKFLEQIAPVREKLLAPETGEREAFVQLNRMEEIIAEERARLESESLAPHAAALADTFEAMEGMGALAAALRSQNFSRAEKLAADAGNALAASEGIPQGSDKAGQKAGELAKGLPEKGALAQGLQQFSQGASQQNAKQMSQGMRSLQQSLNRQNQNQQRQQQMRKQLDQLSQCKSCIGEGKYLNFGQMPSLCQGNNPGDNKQGNDGNSSGNGKNGGTQAGSEKASQRYGQESEINGQLRAEQLDGALSEGESETTITTANQGMQETARRTEPAFFKEYEKLSQEAIHDEKIPAAYRQAIRTYFERIRPENTQ